MALAYASIPRFHQHRLQTAKGLGSTASLRFSVFTIRPKRSQLQHPTTAARFVTVLSTIHSSSDAVPTPHDATGYIENLAASISNGLYTANPNVEQGLVVADVDPTTAKLAIGILGPFLSAFGFLFIIRIVMSWYPKLPVGKFPYVVAYAPTEPLLSVTRKLIPPLGGVDVTPVVWFGLISFLSEILVGPQGLLVLLSQQV